MDLKTHLEIDCRLCGEPQTLGEGFASVELTTTPEMVVDEHGLAHGGFVFGLADHSAMLAVNHPNVVLGQASSRFLKPVRAGETLLAVAEIVQRDGRRRTVQVEVRRGDETVMSAELVCYVLDHHVLHTPSSDE